MKASFLYNLFANRWLLRTICYFIAHTTLLVTFKAEGSPKNDAGFGLHIGNGSYGSGDTNGVIPHPFYYRGTFVTTSGFEGNLSLGFGSLGKRFRVLERLHFGLHGGYSVLADGISPSAHPSLHASFGYQPFCWGVCLSFETFSGVAFKKFSGPQFAAPVSLFSVGLYLWY